MNENRHIVVMAVFLLIGLIFLGRLFALQVLNDELKLKAENNLKLKVTQHPYRGLITDRNGELIAYNTPLYDLYATPIKTKGIDTARFCNLLGITKEEYVRRMEDAIVSKRYRLPYLFEKQISHEKFARLQDALVDFNGFYIEPRTARAYKHPVMANALGYIAEISGPMLAADSSKYYRSGDYLGHSGIEKSYEPFLRGKRGVKYKVKNALGREVGSLEEGRFDTLAIPGENLVTTIDLELQKYGEKLMAGKVGSIVAIEPATGEILAIISAPTYDPNLLSGKNYGKNFGALQRDTLAPLFNRALMATYPPGSMFKCVQSLIALQEGVITATEKIYCDGSLIGDHAPTGYYDVPKAIQNSSNNYFVKVFRRVLNQNVSDNTYKDTEIGLEKWQEYVHNFGLGVKPQVDIPNAKSGYIPGPSYYNNIYGEGRWKFSNIYSLSIGQGEMLITPLQMANLAALIANRGYYYSPHLVKSIGTTNHVLDEYKEKNYAGIDPEHYEMVVQGMAQVITHGTGQYRAKLKDIEVCGKTSTVQNPHGEDHSGFMAFAPRNDPKIAIAVYVENAGQGARSAAAIASLMIEKYIKGGTDRPYIEDYVLKGDFL
ncbi:penicillin-binding protein 2 [Roseivirga sp. BDSF3-8]|uniref:penicillin-binding protein 2 n=1 Tax=Roseivirga sp. BDSF3-8 TaxID=3241598 RepID=UPI003531FD3E